MRLIRKTYPHIEWVISFADGSQCGDGTISKRAKDQASEVHSDLGGETPTRTLQTLERQSMPHVKLTAKQEAFCQGIADGWARLILIVRL
jgi:hypothetical protein